MERDEPADRIRERMAVLRRELSYDVEDVGRTARAMTDWTLYVRRFPWACAAVALTAGYLLVPRKQQTIYPDAATLANFIKQDRLRVEPATSQLGPKVLLKNLLATGAMSAGRLGINLLLQRLAASTSARVAAESESTPEASWKA